MGKLNRRKFCECGLCNLVVKLGNRFATGHQTKGKGKQKSPSQLCACNCGLMTKPGNTYINGHGRRKYLKPTSNHHPCACGLCDKLVASDKRFYYQHGTVKYLKPIVNHHLCACGKCGIMVASNRRFVVGHSSKGENNPMFGTHRTDEQKQSHADIMKGCKSWNKGLTKETDIRVAKAAIKNIGNKGFTGHHHTEETKVKQCNANLNKIVTEETKAKMRESWKERQPVTEETKAKMSESSKRKSPQSIEEKYNKSISGKRYWASLYGEKRLKRLEKWLMGMKTKPTKPELYIIYLLNLLFPGEYKYTGDFTFWINGKNPDFVNCNGQKKCIEFNGNYWHQNDIPGQRELIFSEFGYDTLMLSDIDLTDEDLLKAKIIEFHNKPNPYAEHMNKEK